MKKFFRYAIYIIVGGSFTFILIETIKAKNTGFEEQTLWSWMDLLIIPLVLVVGGFILNRSEKKTEWENLKDRQQEEALRTYIDGMSELLLKHFLLTTKKPEVKNVARMRTLSVLRRLNRNRKVQVIKFLYEADLINKKNVIVNLKGANLIGVNLEGAYLESINLAGTILDFVNFNDAYLVDANLEGAWLIQADLVKANLKGASLEGAELYAANLGNAKLVNANLKDASLVYANLHGAEMEGINREGADIGRANIAEGYSRIKVVTRQGYHGYRFRHPYKRVEYIQELRNRTREARK